MKASFDPENTKVIFASKSTPNLAFNVALLKLISFQPLVDVTTASLLWMTQSSSVTRTLLSPLAWLVKKTVFRHFAAGETFDDCIEVAGTLRQQRIVPIIDHSTEEMETAEAWDDNLRNKHALLRKLAHSLADTHLFVPLKLTALCSPELLETMTSSLHDHVNAVAASTTDKARAAMSWDAASCLDANDQGLLLQALERLSSLCDAASALRIRLLLDAEQSHRQPAINYIARLLSERFNTDMTAPVVYNTYQLYLRDTPLSGLTCIRTELEHAAQNRFTFAAKMVRGAYVASENGRAQRTAKASAIWQTKAETDMAYDTALRELLESVGRGYPHVAVVVATHNKTSVKLAVAAMDELRIDSNDSRVHIAQIYGMCDNLTAALAHGGYNALKLVVYGEYSHVMPWLLRRLQENSDVFAATQQERLLLSRELQRRLVG